MNLGDELRGLADRVTALEATVAELEAEKDWHRQVGVMAALWPYAIRRPRFRIPAQRRPHPAEHRRR